MAKNIVIGIVIFFIVTTGVTIWIVNSVDSSVAEGQTRTDADFVTEHFIITELWEMQQKKGNSVLSSYLFMKAKGEPVKLRVPFQGTEGNNVLARQLNEGDTITVTVLKHQLEEARQEGIGKAVQRFIMGDKREVTIYKLSLHNEVLIDRDIHAWDEAKVTLLRRLSDNPYILLVPAFILFAIIGLLKRKTGLKKNAA